MALLIRSLHRAAVADVDLLHIAVDVARGDLHDLLRAVVEVHPDRLAVRALHGLVRVHDRLREVVARRQRCASGTG